MRITPVMEKLGPNVLHTKNCLADIYNAMVVYKARTVELDRLLKEHQVSWSELMNDQKTGAWTFNDLEMEKYLKLKFSNQ